MSELGGNYSPEQEFRNRPMYTGEGIPVPEMSESLVVDGVMESKQAQNILNNDENLYAQLTPYRGGKLEDKRTGLQVGIKYMAAIWEDERVIGYTMRPDDVKDFLIKEYEKNKSAAA